MSVSVWTWIGRWWCFCTGDRSREDPLGDERRRGAFDRPTSRKAWASALKVGGHRFEVRRMVRAERVPHSSGGLTVDLQPERVARAPDQGWDFRGILDGRRQEQLTMEGTAVHAMRSGIRGS